MTKLLSASFFAALLAVTPITPTLFAQQSQTSTQDNTGQNSLYGQDPSGNQQGYGAPAMNGSTTPPESTNPNLANPVIHQDQAGLDQQRTNRTILYPRRPAPPTSFQRLVQRTVGQNLPLYGHNLFLTPGTFSALPDAPPTTDYLVSVGDQVLVRMWGPVTMNEALTIDRAGNIFVPQVGAIHVAGLAYSALSDHIRAATSRVFRNFNLSVDLGRLHSIQVFVTGEAERPGTYTVSSLSTLVNAVFASGGPSPAGSMRRIELRRDGQVVTTFDFYDLLLHGDKSKDTHLLPGDVIFIAPVGPQVAFFGQVNVPAIFELKGQETLGALLSLAGGPNSVASGASVSVDQIVGHAYRQTQTVPLTADGLATPLKDGDLLSLYGISNRYENTVTIRGNLAEPGRFAWHAGMRLSDIIPERASLLTPNYWEVRNAEGRPNPFLQPLQGSPGGPGQAPYVNGNSSSSLPQSMNSEASPTNGNNSNYGNNQNNGYGSNAPGGNNRNSTYDAYGNLTSGNEGDLASGGVNTDGTSSSGASLPGARGGVVNESAGAPNPGNTENGSSSRVAIGSTRATRVTIPAPEIDWAYAVVERTNRDTLKNELFPFNLGRLVLDKDQSQNLELKPGDVVTIFSQADFNVAQEQQTKFVRIEGEVASAGVYSVMPGENLQSLVERAGGLTSNAYLFGAQFTRESTRVLQQQRLEEYTDKLAMDMERSTANTALSLAGSTDPSVLTVEQEVIAQLRRQRATGRIVLDFKTNTEGIAAIPPLPLENGDVLTIPSKPLIVSVIGSVPNQSSFLYRPKATVKYYLAQAGRPDRDSDPKHAFVIRANGAVLARQNSGFWGNTFDGLQLAPGDTLVVPAKLFKISLLRTLLQSSTAFSSLALVGAALANN